MFLAIVIAAAIFALPSTFAVVCLYKLAKQRSSNKNK